MRLNSKIKWLIIIVGILVVICLFWISENQKQDQLYKDKSYVYKEEVAELFRVIGMEPGEVELMVMSGLSEQITWEDIYYIFDSIGYGDVVGERAAHPVSDKVMRTDFADIYQNFLTYMNIETEGVFFTFWGHVPKEDRIITDVGNFSTTLPKDYFQYGSKYEAICSGNQILLVQTEKTPLFKSRQTEETGSSDTDIVGTLEPQEVPLPSTVNVVLTNDNGQEAMRSGFQIKATSPVSVSAGDTLQIYGAETVFTKETLAGLFTKSSVVTITPETNQSLFVMEANAGTWSAPYRGILQVHKKGEQYWIVNQVPLEEYLLGVVPGEMPERFSLEALKAQAVCARTYVCNMIKGDAYAQYRADVDDSVSCQVYNKHGENAKATQAVQETTGVVLLQHGDKTVDFETLPLADIYYFSTSCGYTTGLEAWGENSLPYLTCVSTVLSGENVSDWDTYLKRMDVQAYDSGSNYFRWKANVILPEGYSLQIARREESGIVTKICYTGGNDSRIVETENEIRRDLGSYVTELTDYQGAPITIMDMLPSAWFTIEAGSTSNQYVLYGGGYGHGIGMSQYGAHGMAEQGMTYDQILAFYFPGTVLNYK